MTDQTADIRPWWRGRGVWFWFFLLTTIVLSIWMLSVLGGNFYNALYPALPEAEARLPGACYSIEQTGDYYACPNSPWEESLRNYPRVAVQIPMALAEFLTPLVFLAPLLCIFAAALLLRVLFR